MALSSLQLEAFFEVAKTGSFTRAAKNLHLTQSALSQRMSNLEHELATVLLIRDPSGLRLTAAGEKLLRYCQVRENLETELLKTLSSPNQLLGGVVRIGGVSSVMRSVVMPCLQDLLAEHPGVNVEMFVREIPELGKMLARKEVDFVLTPANPIQPDVRSLLLGHERYVLVAAVGESEERREVYLDHDGDDQTTKEFFAYNGEENKLLRRSYCDEVYALMDGVRRGWGRGVLPLHLLGGDARLCVVGGYKPMKVPLMLQYVEQPYETKLRLRVLEDIQKGAEGILMAVPSGIEPLFGL